MPDLVGSGRHGGGDEQRHDAHHLERTAQDIIDRSGFGLPGCRRLELGVCRPDQAPGRFKCLVRCESLPC